MNGLGRILFQKAHPEVPNQKASKKSKKKEEKEDEEPTVEKDYIYPMTVETPLRRMDSGVHRVVHLTQKARLGGILGLGS